MFCNKCGKQIKDGSKFCDGCGATQALTEAPNAFAGYSQTQTKSGVFYATVIVALISAILPFCKWVEVPVYNAISSWMGGSGNLASYSLFGYIFSIGSTQVSGGTAAVILILALLALVGVIFNVMFVIKALCDKTNYHKYGTMAAVMMIVMSALFIIIVGLISAILKMISITFISWLALALAIANIVLIKKSKQEMA